MRASVLLSIAKNGDQLLGDDLQTSIDTLRSMASALDPLIQSETDVAAARELGRRQQGLRSTAMALVSAQINLLAGQAKVTAEHINAAVDYAERVVRTTKDLKARLAKIGFLLDFLAVVSSGNGVKIVEAAITLKANLDAA